VYRPSIHEAVLLKELPVALKGSSTVNKTSTDVREEGVHAPTITEHKDCFPPDVAFRCFELARSTLLLQLNNYTELVRNPAN
jgi:hypothetical protein